MNLTPELLADLRKKAEAATMTLERENMRLKALMTRAGHEWRRVVTGRQTVADAREKIDPIANLENGP